MSENNDERIIEFCDEDGNIEKMEMLDVIEYSDEEYLVLLPVKEDDGGVIILRIEYDGDEESYTSIDDDELLDKIFEMFKARNSDIFDFE